MERTWRPDWRDQAQYPDPSNTTRLQWAWEFLRRNPEYQRLWDDEIKQHYEPGDLDRFSQQETAGQSPGRVTRARIRMPMQDRFHIASFPPPPPSEPQAKLLFDTQFIQYEVGGDIERRVKGDLKPDQMVLWFDLARPPDLQFENAKRAFLAEVKRRGIFVKGTRLRADRYRDYLRVLDAADQRVSTKDIAAVIYPKKANDHPDYLGNQTVRDDLEAAQLLRDHTFWQVALSAGE